MKALLGTLTYGPVDAECASALRQALMSAAKTGVTWMGDLAPDRMSFMDGRNFVVDAYFAELSYADGIMWVDSDIVPESHSIAKLLNTARTHDFDFLSGVYHQRVGEHKPCFFQFIPPDKYKQCEVYEPDVITPAGACGFGFVWTSGKLIKAISDLPSFSRDRGGWFPDHRFSKTSEDLGFCTLAREAGFQLYVDTGIQVGHMGTGEVITREHSLRRLSKGKDLAKVVMG